MVVAIYEAGEFVDPKSLSYLVNGSFSTLFEFIADYVAGVVKVYEVGFCASQNLAKRLISKEPGIQDTFRRFIGKGRAHYPINVLKEAGVDFTTSVPFEKRCKILLIKWINLKNFLINSTKRVITNQ